MKRNSDQIMNLRRSGKYPWSQHRVKWCVGIVFFTFSVAAAPPAWWTTRGVLNSSAADDYAAVNQGQVKNIAKAAAAEMEVRLPGGAGQAINSMVSGWATPSVETDDFAAVNLGQLKAVAKPFYDRLIGLELASSYPWQGPGKTPDDFAMANIGQVKNLFSFDLTTIEGLDSDHDGIPDFWEIQYAYLGLNPNISTDAGMPAPGGLSFLQKYKLRLNPAVADSDDDGVVDSAELTAGTDPTSPDNPKVKLVVFGFSSQ